jgi:hypothetical protein
MKEQINLSSVNTVKQLEAAGSIEDIIEYIDDSLDGKLKVTEIKDYESLLETVFLFKKLHIQSTEPTNKTLKTQTAFVSDQAAIIFNLDPIKTSYSCQMDYFDIPLINSFENSREKEEHKEEIKKIITEIINKLGAITQDGIVYSENEIKAEKKLRGIEAHALRRIESIEIDTIECKTGLES